MMNNYIENDSFSFDSKIDNEKNNSFSGYSSISGLGESNYENENLFDTEAVVSNRVISNPNLTDQFNYQKDDFDSPFMEPDPFVKESKEDFDNEYTLEQPEGYNANAIQDTLSYYDAVDEPVMYHQTELNSSEQSFEEYDENETIESPSKNYDYNSNVEVSDNMDKINTDFLEDDQDFGSLDNDIEFELVAPKIQNVESIDSPSNDDKVVNNSDSTPTITSDMMSDTPIEELNKLTEYNEDSISTFDIKKLFNKVGMNVQEASDIFIKNTEMKERLDTKFEELKELQAVIENSKKTQLEEINSYKEEVLGKLNEKKDEIEKRINKLKEFQKNLEKEKEEFEKFRKSEKEEIERVQKEVQEAYDSRREELTYIEDSLRKQKDALDDERNQLSLDRIQYESDKNELANNLLKFNEIVDTFTNGMERVNGGE